MINAVLLNRFPFATNYQMPLSNVHKIQTLRTLVYTGFLNSYDKSVIHFVEDSICIGLQGTLRKVRVVWTPSGE